VRNLVDEALASVPTGSTHAQLISHEKNPLMIERKEHCYSRLPTISTVNVTTARFYF